MSASASEPFTVEDLRRYPYNVTKWELRDGILYGEPAEPFTLADLETFPDDGRRYELFDGLLVVTPAPTFRHQVAALGLGRILAAAAPSDLIVMPLPINVQQRPGTHTEPDLTVVRKSEVDVADADRHPLLVAEVLSPSTHSKDRHFKATYYARMAIPSYWLVDPAEPSITVLELIGDAYVETATVRGDAAYDVTSPFPVTLRPAELLADLD